VDQKEINKNLGDYLAKKLSGKTDVIDKALDIQAELEKLGIYKPLGRIIVENGELESSFLDECLLSQRVDILAKVPLFASLPRESLAELAEVLKNVILPPGEVVCKRSDKADSYYVIASGSVKVGRQEDDDAKVTFAVRGPGEGFGEVSLLTSAPHSATVETIEKTSLILIPKDAFLNAVFSHPVAAKACARILAARLGRGYVQIVEEYSTEQAYRQFISEEMMRGEPMLIGNSVAVMRLVSDIDTAAGKNEPILVTGETGAEMKDVASLIHEMGRDGKGLFMGMDAKNISPAATDDAQGDDRLLVKLSQYAALFGRGHNILPFAPDRRLGLLTMAHDGTVVIENVEYLDARVQKKLADYLEKGCFLPAGETEVLRSNARIVATSSADLAAMAEREEFDSRLYRLISVQALLVPPLRKRKKDLSMIVDELIRRNNRQLDKNVRGIDEQAYKSIMMYDWPGNMEELRVVIRRAVSIARGTTLILEDLFIGPPPVTGKFTINLLKYGPIQDLFRSRLYPRAGILITAPFIALLIGLGLFGTQEPDRNVALILTWGLWEPMLIMSAFFVARAWCGVCPVGELSKLVRRSVGLHLKAPLFLRDHGFYFSALGIAVIIAAESASGMLQSPRATALLVLAIAAQAALIGFLFQRSTWCRYLCPLGSIVGTFSHCSVLELRSNYGICNSACLKHECYIGDKQHEGCPMFEGPFFMTSNRNCVLCGTCVKLCPNDSPILNLRLPGYDLWAVRIPDKSVVVVGIALIGTQLFRGLEQVGWLHGTMVTSWPGALLFMALSVLASTLYVSVAGKLYFGNSGPEARGQWYKIVYVLLPLVFAFEAGYHLERMLTIGGQFFAVIGRQVGLVMELPGISASMRFIRTVQTLLILMATAGSAGVLWKLLRMPETGIGMPSKKRYWPVLLLPAIYLWMFLAKG
jgi:transcriptional regulator with AAA-type ATPase domain/NAD-dependent dihydropyrimidine dehydrogenase PreA subunit